MWLCRILESKHTGNQTSSTVGSALHKLGVNMEYSAVCDGEFSQYEWKKPQFEEKRYSIKIKSEGISALELYDPVKCSSLEPWDEAAPSKNEINPHHQAGHLSPVIINNK